MQFSCVDAQYFCVDAQYYGKNHKFSEFFHFLKTIRNIVKYRQFLKKFQKMLFFQKTTKWASKFAWLLSGTFKHGSWIFPQRELEHAVRTFSHAFYDWVSHGSPAIIHGTLFKTCWVAGRPLQNTKPVKLPSSRASCLAFETRIARPIQRLPIPMSILLKSQLTATLKYLPQSAAMTLRTPVPVSIKNRWRSNPLMNQARMVRKWNQMNKRRWKRVWLWSEMHMTKWYRRH